ICRRAAARTPVGVHTRPDRLDGPLRSGSIVFDLRERDFLGRGIAKHDGLTVAEVKESIRTDRADSLGERLLRCEGQPREHDPVGSAETCDGVMPVPGTNDDRRPAAGIAALPSPDLDEIITFAG